MVVYGWSMVVYGWSMSFWCSTVVYGGLWWSMVVYGGLWVDGLWVVSGGLSVVCRWPMVG